MMLDVPAYTITYAPNDMYFWIVVDNSLPSTIIAGMNSVGALRSVGIELSQRSKHSNKDIVS